MKKIFFLLSLIFLIVSCKKENISPTQQNILSGIYRCSHFRNVTINPNPINFYQRDTTVDEGYPGKEDIPEIYIKYSAVNNNSVDMTQYIYGYTEYDYSTGSIIKRDIIRGPFKCTISGNSLIIPPFAPFNLNIHYTYEVNADSLIITHFYTDGYTTLSGEEEYHRVSNLPSISSGGGSGGGSNCQYGQCQATAQSTGERCKKCVSNPGDTKCHLHN
jgi:hypothetical protein